jgi:hypothetical protein
VKRAIVLPSIDRTSLSLISPQIFSTPHNVVVGYALGGTTIGVVIEGPITAGDYARFVKAVHEAGPGAETVYVMSPGGDVAEAMEIGFLIRTLRLRTSVPRGFSAGAAQCIIPKLSDDRNCTCQSACFFIFAAGVHRFGNVVGIHTVFMDHRALKDLSSTEAARVANDLKGIVGAYLDKMSVPRTYLDKMLALSSSEIEYLSEEDIKRDFSGFISDYSEWVMARCGDWRRNYDEAASLQGKKNRKIIDQREQARLSEVDLSMQSALECEFKLERDMVAVRQNLTAQNAASATRAEPAMLDHGRPCHPDCSAPDHPRKPTSQSRVREPGAAPAVGCLPSHPSEADRSLVRPAVLSRPPAGLAGLEVRLDDRPTRHGHRVASPRLRVVLDPTVASEGRPSAGRRRRATPDPRDGPSEPALGRAAHSRRVAEAGIRRV